MEPMEDVAACPVCRAPVPELPGLAEHFVARAEESDAAHIMWLNRNVTKLEVDAAELARLLRAWAEGHSSGAPRVAR